MGIIKGLFKAKMYLLLFGAGYVTHSCVHADTRYVVKTVRNVPYLVDQEQDVRLPIHPDTFQVGGIEHRIRGLLAEQDLVHSLDALTNHLEEEK